MSSVKLTKEQFDELEKRAEEIENKKIPENSIAIEKAKEFGDLSENAEYHSAKELHEKLFSELNTIRDRLNRAEIIKVSENKDRADIGHKILLLCLDTGEELNFQLIGESGNGIDLVDVYSKLGKNVLHKKVGDIISFEANDQDLGTLRYELKEIS